MKQFFLLFIFIFSISSAFSQETIDSLDQEYPVKQENRNVTAIGFGIGGINLIGLDYEFRVHDNIGIHVGAGFLGATFGVKLHTGKKRHSPFFNLSLKDGGFGQVEMLGIEFGGIIPFKKGKKLGLYGQAGAGFILSTSDKFREAYGNGGPPGILFSFGVGLCW